MRDKVLIVEDEPNLLAALEYTMEREGYDALTADNGEAGLRIAREESPDIIILDVMLPALDGFEVCRLIRRESGVPIIMLTARGDVNDRVTGLDLGADDYLVKPLSVRELVARVRNMLRRSSGGAAGGGGRQSETVVSGNLSIDMKGHTASLNGEPLYMKPREFALIALLAANKGRAFTRDQILERLWGHDYIGDSRTVDVHVRWLREKIEPDPSKPRRIVTIRGVGYRFDE